MFQRKIKYWMHIRGYMDCGVILSNGIGSRFGTDIPKQFNTIAGNTVISYSIEALLQSERIEKIIIVVDDHY